VRDAMRTEGEEILDLSARMLSTIHARATGRTDAPRPAPDSGAVEPNQTESEGLIGLARRLTHRPAPRAKRHENRKQRLGHARAPGGGGRGDKPGEKELRPVAASALGALQAALSDRAIDLQAVAAGPSPSQDEWRSYLQGDRSLFAKRLAQSIDVDSSIASAGRIGTILLFARRPKPTLSNSRRCLAHARDGDGDGLLTSSLLSADTGKIYLSIAYALGRLS